MEVQLQVGGGLVQTGRLERIGGNDSLSDLDGLIPFLVGHEDFHVKDADAPFVGTSAGLYLRNMLVSILEVLLNLLKDAPTVAGVEVEFRLLDLKINPGDVAELMHEVEITPGALEITLSANGGDLRLGEGRSAVKAVENDVGILDAVPAFLPEPADLAFGAILDVRRGHIAVQVGQALGLIGLAENGYVGKVELRQHRGVVTEKGVAHVAFAGGNGCIKPSSST